VANRGEVAIRIIRTCRELGLETVGVYSEADTDAPHTRLADEAVLVGRSPSLHSYLNIPAILSAAYLTKADAIHPGYGFLAENRRFAEQCRKRGLRFIGPSPEVIGLMGDKIAARKTAHRLGVPVIPGSSDQVSGQQEMRRWCRELGFPVLLKAAYGGGGRGMRTVCSDAEVGRAFESSQGEAFAAFGDGTIYVEKVIPGARHVEVQILGDGRGNVIHLGERDCTVQRSHQKILEEAPCPVLSDHLRKDILEAAVVIARHVGYESAGTVEFLLELGSGRFYFLEMNTRLQVEHPITEAITGLDIVEQQLLLASGEPLRIRQKEVRFSGHAIECRINAEDADQGFRPSPGQITAVTFPTGPGIRIDTFCEAGADIPPYYDSLLAKVIAHAPSRERALARMKAALKTLEIRGLSTTIPFHLRLLDCPVFTATNEVDVFWVDSLIHFGGG
jgi:acetyl-CoA carboxylase biotin carboxylase subunit